MRSRIRIKIENWKKTSASYRYTQLKWKVTIIHNDKIHTLLLCTKYPILNPLNESLDWFGSEMRSRIRIKIENWKKTCASYRYIQFKWMVTLIHHYSLQTLLLWTKNPISITINESLDWFGSEMRSRIRIKIKNWNKTSASYRYTQLSGL